MCLLNTYELRTYGLTDFGDQVRAAGLEFVSHPVIEMAAPDSLEDTAELVQTMVGIQGSGISQLY